MFNAELDPPRLRTCLSWQRVSLPLCRLRSRRL